MSEQGHSAETICADIVRTRDFPSYAVSLFIGKDQRRGWLALAAFNAEVAHVRDAISQPMPGEIRLQWWRDVLTGAGSAEGIDGNPIASELKRAITTYALPIDTLIRLIDAHVFDVYDDPMPDMAAVEAHCRDTSSALFALRARILGANDETTSRAAEHAGIAEGLVDVMLSLPKHAARRQMFLPADLLTLKDANAEEIFLRQSSSQLKDVLAHLRIEAQKQHDAARVLMRDVPMQARAAFLSLALVKKNLERLKHSEPFSPPIPSRLSVLWTLWRAALSR